MKKDHIIIISLAAVILVLASAGAASYLTKAQLQSDKIEQASAAERISKKNTQSSQRTNDSAIKWDSHPRQVQQVQAQPQLPPCDDNNIVGTAAGAVGGGLVGSQFGKGNGKTAAAVLGVVGGAALGNSMIPTHNVTCR